MSKPSVNVFTPYRHHAAIDLGGRRWRTQLLPLGSISYKGRKLQFTKDYLAGIVKAFKDKAFNQVPFQLADGDNKHNNDPERYRGEIAELELTSDGLDLILEATEDGDALIRKNPKLGVSARIFENFDRSDGKSWPAALQHVLGTLDPHIAGMRQWTEAAAFSNEGEGRVLDLTEATYDEPEGDRPMPLSKERLKELLKQMRDGGQDISDEDLDEVLETVAGEVDDEDGNELTDEELEAILAEADALEGEETPPASTKPEPVAASRTGKAALELASLRASYDEQAIELGRVRASLAAQAFANEKATFVAAGLSPKLVELARPLLEGDGQVIQLSNGDEVDAGAVMRRVLVELTNTVKMLDLGNLMGNSEIPDEEKQELEKAEKDRAEFVVNERKRLGL